MRSLTSRPPRNPDAAPPARSPQKGQWSRVPSALPMTHFEERRSCGFIKNPQRAGARAPSTGTREGGRGRSLALASSSKGQGNGKRLPPGGGGGAGSGGSCVGGRDGVLQATDTHKGGGVLLGPGTGGAEDIPLGNVAPDLQFLSLWCHPAMTDPSPSLSLPSPSNNNLNPRRKHGVPE